jgi:hypothetical protein
MAQMKKWQLSACNPERLRTATSPQGGIPVKSKFAVKYVLASIMITALVGIGWVDPTIAKTNSEQADERQFSFPATAGGFTRRNDTETELTGIFARANYVKAIGKQDVLVRIAIIHLLEMSPKEHFAIRRANLTNQIADVRPSGEGEYRMRGLPKGAGYFGRFDSGSAEDRMAYGIWTFDYGAWDIFIRADYPKNNRNKAEAEIRKLLENLDWSLLAKTKPENSID